MSIFVVENTKTDEVVLVEAKTGAQALRHVTKAAYSVKVAKASDVAFHMGNGVKGPERAAAETDAEQAAVRG